LIINFVAAIIMIIVIMMAVHNEGLALIQYHPKKDETKPLLLCGLADPGYRPSSSPVTKEDKKN
jgi:hypothetical protein